MLEDIIPSRLGMPHSPRTPTRPRLAAGLEYASPQSNGPSPQSDSYSSPRPFQTHRTSLYSIPSPSTSQPTSSHDRRCSFGMTNGFGSIPNEDDGLGNLADELAEAWDEDIHGEPEEEELGEQVDGTALVHDGQLDLSKRLGDSSDINTTAELMAPSIWTTSSDPSSPTKRRSRPKNHRQFSRDGEFDHSNNSSADANINSPLIARMTSIEILACEGLESNGNGEDSIIERFANSLKDLGSQTGLENGATRSAEAPSPPTSLIQSANPASGSSPLMPPWPHISLTKRVSSRPSPLGYTPRFLLSLTPL